MLPHLTGVLESAWDMGGVLFGVAPFLLAALVFLLPREKRGLLRVPLLTFAGVVVLTLIGWLVPDRGSLRGLSVAGFALLLLTIVRSVLVFLTETRMGGWLFPTVPKIVADVVQALLYLAAVLLTLHAAGMEPGSLLTTSALLTAVLGLALQDTLGNLFSGLALQLGRPFDVGDWVELDQQQHSQAGRVVEVGWRATKIITLDHVEIIVPNGMMAKALLRNVTRPTPVSRRNIAFTASYRDPPADVQSAALEAVAGVTNVLPSPAPSAIVTAFGDSTINYTLRYFTADIAASQVTDSDVRARLWYVFKRRGLEFPFPQRDVNFRMADPARELEAATTARAAVLRRIELFAKLDADDVERLARRSETRLYAPLEPIVVEGHAGDELFIVVDGDVRVLAGSEEVARLREGDFFGEMSLLTGEDRTATVEAVGPCRLVVVGHQALKRALDDQPELAERLSAAQVERQRALELHRRGSASALPAADVGTVELLARIRSFFS